MEQLREKVKRDFAKFRARARAGNASANKPPWERRHLAGTC
jgi:hypothetical protein